MEDNLYLLLMFAWQAVVSTFFDPQFPPLVANIFFCFSNNQGTVFTFHSCHLSFNDIIKRPISSRMWAIKLAFLCRIFFRGVLFPPISSRTYSLVTFSDHFIFSIPFQHYISVRKNKTKNCVCVCVCVCVRARTRALISTFSYFHRLGPALLRIEANETIHFLFFFYHFGGPLYTIMCFMSTFEMSRMNVCVLHCGFLLALQPNEC